MIAINLTSVFVCMQHELRQMAEQGSGSIVNTSSGAGVIAAPGLPHYVAAKHGVLGLTKSRGTGVRDPGHPGERRAARHHPHTDDRGVHRRRTPRSRR